MSWPEVRPTVSGPLAVLLTGAALAGTAYTAVTPSVASLRIDEILSRPAAQRTLWGVLVRDLDSGSTVFARNPEKLFLPASTAKLFSTALALRRLGGEYRYRTVVAADGGVDANGVLSGDLVLVGGGDPNLSSRGFPFRKRKDYGPDRLAPMRDMAVPVMEAGIRRIAGDIVGDDSRYVWQPYPRGWSYADTLAGYGSAVSALVFNDNLVNLVVNPGAVGGPARLRVVPQLEFYSFSNRTLTMAGQYVNRSLATRRGAGNRTVVLSGQIPSRSRGRTLSLAAVDAAHYAAVAFRTALQDAGIMVDGRATPRHLLPDDLRSLRSGTGRPRPAPATTIADFQSETLREVIRVVNKESQNLHAEMLLREVALQESGIGSREAAFASMRRFLAEVGLGTSDSLLRDGSGLSRHNLVSPAGMVQLLDYMWGSPDRDAFVDSLAVAGQDGTLDWRFRRSVARGRVHAKTGSMSHVQALSGYIRLDGERTLAFAIFANNFGLASSSTRQLIDAIVTSLVAPDPLGNESPQSASRYDWGKEDRAPLALQRPEPPQSPGY